MFVTSAVNEGAFLEPSTGIFGNDLYAGLIAQGLTDEAAMARVSARDVETTSATSPPVRWMLSAFDVDSGELRWERQIQRARAPGGRYRKNTYASETPVTDGERLYVYIGNVGLYAYDLEGAPLWARSLAPYPIYFDFGVASSPGHRRHPRLHPERQPGATVSRRLRQDDGRALSG